jgi:NitT/TauT family transport system substrate-binding protein
MAEHSPPHPSRHRPRMSAPALVAALAACCLVLACAPSTPTTAQRPAAGGAQTGAATVPGDVPTGAAATTPPQPTRVRVAFSEFTAGQTINWVTLDSGFYTKHGLDVDLQYIASSQTIAAAMANEVDVSIGGGYAAINSRVAGSDLMIFLGGTNWYPYELMVVPEINGPADLRGKTIGISRFGSSSDVATRAAMRHFGLEVDRDVSLLQVGSLQERVAAMKAGAIVAGLVSPPETVVMRRMGFKGILELRTIGEQEMNNQAYATASYMRANEATVQAFVNAQIEGLHYARNNREHAERIIGQYLKLDDPEALAEAYDHYIARRDDVTLRPATEAAQRFLAEFAATDGRGVGLRLEDVVDTRFVDRAVASGLVARLYGPGAR